MSDHNEAPRALGRRQFLTLGSAFALSPWLARLAVATPLTSPEETAPGAMALAAAEPLSVGYLVGSDEPGAARTVVGMGAGALAADTGPLEVVPASELPTDLALAVGPARLRILGLYPGVPEADGPAAIDLDVLFPSDDPAVPGPIPFFAWSYNVRPVSQASPPVGLYVHGATGVSFALRVREDGDRLRRVVRGGGGTPGGTVRRATLTPLEAADAPRLHRGLFLLGVGPATWARRTVLPPEPQAWSTEYLSVVVSVEPA